MLLLLWVFCVRWTVKMDLFIFTIWLLRPLRLSVWLQILLQFYNLPFLSIYPFKHISQFTILQWFLLLFSPSPPVWCIPFCFALVFISLLPVVVACVFEVMFNERFYCFVDDVVNIYISFLLQKYHDWLLRRNNGGSSYNLQRYPICGFANKLIKNIFKIVFSNIFYFKISEPPREFPQTLIHLE